MFWTYMLGPATLPRTHEGRGAVASGGGSAGPGTPGPARAHPGATCARSEPSSGVREPGGARRDGRDREHGGGALWRLGGDAGRVLRAVHPGAQAPWAGASAPELTTPDPLVPALASGVPTGRC